MKSFIIILSMLILTSTSAIAVDSDGNYAVWGVGKKSCFGFNKEINGEDSDRFRDYIKGFLTAYNMFTEKTFSITGNMNEDEVVNWLTEYCADNPMFGLETALLNFTFDHYDKRLKSSGRSVGR
jgi:hypothetical protein